MHDHASFNRAYRLVFKASLGQMVVVPETARGGSGGAAAGGSTAGGPGAPRRLALALALALAGPAAWALDAGALPQGGQVAAGQASLVRSGSTLTIDQGSDRAILNWSSFDIGSGAAVRFVQPSSSSVTLNRVTGGPASQIFGTLDANGQVYLVNAAGILFGRTAQVDVGGLLASSLGIRDSDFLAGRDAFGGQGAGSVVNLGRIQARNGGRVALLGSTVRNDGQIVTAGGDVALAAGSQVRLAIGAGGRLQVAVDAADVATLVANGGLLQADGGQVVLTARGADALASSVVSNTGTVQARTVDGSTGRILLLADAASGTTQVGGTLDAGAPQAGNGGFIETSAARVQVAHDARVSTQAPRGNDGTWLIDPADFTIARSGGDVSGSALSSYLAGGNVTILTTTSGTAGNGDIFVNDTVGWSQNKLTLVAARNIEINAQMNGSGTAGLALEYGQSAVAAGNAANYTVSAPVHLASTGSFSTKLGSDGSTIPYTILTSLGSAGSTTGTDLQGMTGNRSGNYVLGADIDASATRDWNGGAGFTPVGESANPFTGRFDGLGHVVRDLTIHRPGSNSNGLFGAATNASLRHVGIERASITGGFFASGALVGRASNGWISGVWATGQVSGDQAVGGLAGSVQDGSTVADAWSSADVRGTSSVGGLLGQSGNSTVRHAYATGSVTSTSGRWVGGLVGLHYRGTIDNTYATGAVAGLIDVGGLVGSAGLSGSHEGGVITRSHWDSHSTGQAQGVGINHLGTVSDVSAVTSDPAQAGAANYAFKPGAHVHLDPAAWIRLDGVRPMLASEHSTTIRNAHQLQLMAHDLAAHYVIAADIDAGETGRYDGTVANASGMWGPKGFKPVGGVSAGFSGTLDGRGFAVRALAIDRPSEVFIGLLGGTEHGSEVRDVGVEGGSIVGNNYTGGLVGNNRGAISRSYVTASVTGHTNVGGLAGLTTANGSVSDSYATGPVAGVGTVGGLVGQNVGTLSRSYAAGSVSGTNEVGGLVGGARTSSAISGSVWDTQATGRANGVGSGSATGVAGKTTAQMQQLATFAGWDIDDAGGTGKAWRIYEGHTAPLLRHFLTGVTVTPDSTLPGKTYDGAVASGTGSYTLSDPTATLSGSLGYATTGANAGDYSTGAGTLLLGGLHSGQQGYDISYGASSVSIARKALTIDGVAAQDKVYDRSVAATVNFTGLGGVVGGDDVSLVLGGASFADWNAGANKAVTVSGTTLAGAAAGNYTIADPAGLRAAITPKTIAATITAAGKVYDRSTDAVTSAALGGVVAGDTVGITAGGAFRDWNAGTGKTVDVSGVLSGADAGNYALVTNSTTTADITPRAVTGAVSAADKVYDRSTVAATSATLSGVLAGDAVGLAANGAFRDRNAGTGKTVDVSAVLSGPDAGNYALAVNSTTTADITPRAVTGTIAAADKVYDRTTGATTSGLVNGVLGGDTVDLMASGAFRDRNAGEGKTVDVSGRLSGADAGNYALTTNSTTTADITPRAITGTIAAADKVYDRSTAAATSGTLSGVLAGDTVDIAASGTFRDWNAGTAKTVDVSGVLSGSDAGNYVLTANGSTTADITPRAITGAITAADKVYDRTTGASTTAVVSGVLAGDTVGITAGGAFRDWNAGAGKTVDVTGVLSGVDAGNYALVTNSTTTAAITPRAVTGTIAAAGKVYDRTSAATTSGLVNGVLGGDTVDLMASGAFRDRNAGAGKTVDVSGRLSGADAGNYVLTTNSTTTADITPRGITGTITAADKTYDRTTAATTSAAIEGVIAGDAVGIAASGSFRDRNAASGKTVDVSGVLSGADAGNYALSTNSTTRASITQKVIAATIAAADKVYDGTRGATTSGTLSGVIAGDTVALDSQGAFRDPNAAAGKTVDVLGALSGADAGNYRAVMNLTATADITPAALLVTANDYTRAVNGVPHGGGNGVRYEGFVAGEDASALGGSLVWGGSAQGAVVAGRYTLSPSGLTSGNYRIRYTDGVFTLVPVHHTPTAGEIERQARQTTDAVFTGAQPPRVQAGSKVPLTVADDFVRMD